MTNEGGHRLPNGLWFDQTYDVPVGAFEETGRLSLGVELPRITYAQLGRPNFFGSRPGSSRFGREQIESNLRIGAELTFTPTGGAPLTMAEEINPFAW